jgi:hypothetical protein
MAVPDNFTFSLQDVVNEIGCSGNMQACVDNANPSGYDPNYSGESGLRKFRNYTHAADSISLSYTYLSYYQNGSEKNGVYSVVVTSSGAWTASVLYDYDTMISSFTNSGGDQGNCYVSINWNLTDYSKLAQIEFACGTARAYLSLCQDGNAETCA